MDEYVALCIFVSDSHRKDMECPSSFHFTSTYNMSTFKSRVNKHLLDKRTPHYDASSVTIRLPATTLDCNITYNKICPIITTLGRRVGHRRARLIAPASLLPDTGLCHLFSLANSKWLYRHLSVARASSVKRQGAPRAGEVGNLGG
ncbi:jg23842 [Pararge aegeria aegeria]|uniref:Jg23842 protein n=1 Tax=Pararge aegeria aegeria TaxID=348720 RepID=A0A8S4QU63_9NEOP|nr:jg23842 [Pararge aegeria aegeria]